MQADPSFPSMYQCAKITWANEGLNGFFRGVSQPLFTVSLIKSFVFTTYRHLKDQNQFSSVTAGAMTGFVTALICSPLELGKIQIQLQKSKGHSSKFNGYFDCFKKIFQLHGFRGLYHGLTLQLMRDSLGTSVHFTSYEFFLSHLSSINPTFAPLLAGGLGGTVAWSIIYPFDLIKTRRQTEIFSHKQFSSSMSIVKEILASKRGFKGLYTGFSASVIRAFPIHAINFL